MLKKAYVEITNVCNLRCAFCPGTKRAPRTMSPEEFARVLDALEGRVAYLHLHLMGEPLLHPRLPELLSLTAERGMRLCLVTNGTLLPERADALLAAAAALCHTLTPRQQILLPPSTLDRHLIHYQSPSP